MAKDKPEQQQRPQFVPPEEVAAGLAEQAKARQAPQPDPEKEDLRRRLAELEGKLQEILRAPAGITIDQSFEGWKIWAAKSAQEKTQIVADRLFAGRPGVPHRVSLPGHPSVVLPAQSELEAVALYNQLCGINGVHYDAEKPIKHAVAALPA